MVTIFFAMRILSFNKLSVRLTNCTMCNLIIFGKFLMFETHYIFRCWSACDRHRKQAKVITKTTTRTTQPTDCQCNTGFKGLLVSIKDIFYSCVPILIHCKDEGVSICIIISIILGYYVSHEIIGPNIDFDLISWFIPIFCMNLYGNATNFETYHILPILRKILGCG